MEKIKVMIVDDQYISRNLFEMYVNRTDKYELVFSLESAIFADAFVLKNKIDLVIMDILMTDGSNGLDAAARIKKNSPDTKIIAVTSMPEVSWLDRAKEIGIESFWYKEASEESIIDVMDRTVNGERVYPKHTPVVKLGLAKSSEFTDRELDVLRIMTTGVSNATIAKKLNLTEGTVKNYVHNMLEKTGFESRNELAIEARISGITINI